MAGRHGDPFNPRSTTVLRYAMDKAAADGLTEVGCDHLLLGIFYEGNEAAQFLLESHVTLHDVERELRQTLVWNDPSSGRAH